MIYSAPSYYLAINIVTFYGLAIPTNLHKLHMLQKRAIRITSQAKWRDHTYILFRRNRQLNVCDINNLHVVCFMYQFNSNLLSYNLTGSSKLLNKYIIMTTVVIFISFLISLQCAHSVQKFKVHIYGTHYTHQTSNVKVEILLKMPLSII